MSPYLPRPAVEAIARTVVRPSLGMPVSVRRRFLDLLAIGTGMPSGVAASGQTRGGVEGELLALDDNPPRILYLHGGAYEAGSPRTHRSAVGVLVAAAGHGAFVADYRLSPEHPAPAALEDAAAAWAAVARDARGLVALAGDSAGGGLALALTQAAPDRGLPAPAALALISPWVDLTMSGASYEANRGDAMLSASRIAASADRYASVLGREHPVCSPIRGDLSKLPPTLVHVASGELFLSEAEELAARARAAGSPVELVVHEGLFHDFQTWTGLLREADEALASMGTWIGARLAPA